MRATSPSRRLSRRAFLQATSGLVVGFSLAGCAQNPTPQSQVQASSSPSAKAPATAVAREVAEQQPSPSPAASPPAANAAEGAGRSAANQVDSWLAIDQSGQVTIFSGRVELGTGVRTALAQIAADELYVPFARVTMVQGDTARTPDEGYTAGSKTIQVGGVAVRKAAAEARTALLQLAGDRLKAGPGDLVIKDGVISVRNDPSKSVGYGDLVGGRKINRTVSNDTKTKSPSEYTIVGQSVPRLDLPGKLTGAPSYVQDVRLPGMLHGRVVRPAGVGATVNSVDESSVANMPGLLKVVRIGNFVGVVAQREEQAIQAARQLKVDWNVPASLPQQAQLFDWMRQQRTEDRALTSNGNVEDALRGATELRATYSQPYQMHGSIGPSCAVADVQGDRYTVYSSTQGVYPLRGALAQLLGVAPQNVHVIHVEGSGCYGHNGFDDAAGDAVLLARAVGKPVRVQWMRQDEHGWEPKGPAMLIDLRGAVDGQGKVLAWDYHVWTPTHTTRPGGMAANLLPGQLVEPAPPPARNGYVGGDRNARTNYSFANQHVTAHWLPNSPLRPSALRSLGAMANAFANESFMDELAYAAGVDPVEFRLRHLADPRAQAVVRAAADKSGWSPHTAPAKSGTGRGVAYSQYENNEAYVATVAEVSVDPNDGRVRVNRVVTAHDCGLIINPDGLTNQIEGNVIQATSRALLEQVTFDQSRVTSLDWHSYPILRFPDIPTVEVVLINHPDQPAFGAGEPSTLTVAPVIANAIYDATGARVRDIPLTAERVKAVLGRT